MVLEEVCDSKSTLAKLSEPVILYPQYIKNIRVKDKNETVTDAEVLASVDRVNEIINGNGRVLLRQSGTEPLIRIMIEAETEEKCQEYAGMIAQTIIERGFAVE
jgi:phosphoglucosamine mutase